MATLCSTSCDFYHSSPVQGSHNCSRFRIVTGNGSRSRCHMRAIQVISFALTPRTSACGAASCCFEPEISVKEEVGMKIWSPDAEFAINNYEDQGLHLVRPVPLEEVATKHTSMPPSMDSKGTIEHPGTKLHFLEERDEEILSKRLVSLSRSNKVRGAMELFMSMEVSGLQPNAHACNSLLSSLVRKGSLEDALRVFQIMRKKEMATGHTYTLVLKAVACFDSYCAALKMFNELEEEGASTKQFDVIVYNTMISICARAKDCMEAEKLWRKLGHNAISGTLMTYDLLVSTFVQCGQAELAIGAYHEMLQKGLEPSEDIMKAIIASCTKEGKWELALSTFRRMLSSGMKPNIISFNSIINSLGKAGEAELAFRMYHLLRSSGLQPDVYTWSALLSALYRSNRYGDTLQLFRGIKTKHGSLLNSHLYNIALMSCERLGEWELALQLLWEMERGGMQMSAASYNHVICACEIAREPRVALQVYQHMIHRRCSPDTFTHLSVIRSCIWGSLWKEIDDILKEVVPDSSLFNAVIHGLCLRGKIKLARQIYAKMRSIGLKPDGKTRAFMLQHFRKR